VKTVNGDFQKMSACTIETLRRIPGSINIDDQSASGTVRITYDATVDEGGTPYREFDVTLTKTSDETASVAVKERQTLSGPIDRYTNQIIPVVEACAKASLPVVARAKPKRQRAKPPPAAAAPEK
jgi:hypothetical protein